MHEPALIERAQRRCERGVGTLEDFDQRGGALPEATSGYQVALPETNERNAAGKEATMTWRGSLVLLALLLTGACASTQSAVPRQVATQSAMAAAPLVAEPSVAPATMVPAAPGALSTSASPSAAAAAQAPSCAVTQPPAAAFTPPAPWPEQPPTSDQFWFGTDGLWTALPRDGTWGQLARGEKFWWWSREFDVTRETMPALTVRARRLDGDAPPYEVSGATNGYHESFHWAMLVGVTLPSPGCWEITGDYQGRQLSVVLWVPPA